MFNNSLIWQVNYTGQLRRNSALFLFTETQKNTQMLFQGLWIIEGVKDEKTFQ